MASTGKPFFNSICVLPATVTLVLVLFHWPAASGAAPSRVASLNLCTDSMLFELAEARQIVSVTALSRDESLSYYADAAQTIAVNHGLAEEIISLRPDLILADRYAATGTTALLSRLGYHVMKFDPMLSFADFRVGFMRLAAALDAREKASKLLAVMERELARVEPPRVAARRRAIIYRPNGFSPGSRSLANDMLRAAGLLNLADEFGIEYGGFVPLETLVVSSPDIVLLGGRAERYPALAEQILAHPALTGRNANGDPGSRPLQIDISEKFWTCGGTFVVEAIARLTALAAR
ncbi:MAG TPA: ABC transporter substrate-binding protein [Gammaproteobacteria bacterium]|nr:ABC transporter substrate-binding protein [Gammaproteobacteria bacterium]